MEPFNDISYAQGEYNMDADPNQLIMMKASGFYTVAKIPYLDDQLVRNYANAKRLGKVPFMYHFAGGADPVVEASYFISAVSPLADGDGYCLDFEVDTPDNPGWCLAFLNHVKAVLGTSPWFYVDRSRRQTGDWSQVAAQYGEWIAAPDVPFTADIPGVGIYIAQQGPIVNGVDSDMFFGTLDQAKAYTYKTPAVPNEPVEPTPVVEPPTPPVVITPDPVPPTAPPAVGPPQSDSPPVEPPVVHPPVAEKLSLWQRIINWLRKLNTL